MPRLVDFSDHAHAGCGQFHHLGTGFHIQVFNGGLVRIGNHQQVPAGIRIAVKDYKCIFPARNDQVIHIIRLRLQAAKNAVGIYLRLDKFHSPG